MALPKKGSRQIIVEGKKYKWLIGRSRFVSDWHADPDVPDPSFLLYASYYGLGNAADIRFNIFIESEENARSKACISFYSKMVEGFLGYEQFAKIKPKLIEFVILQALQNGWLPSKKGDFRAEIYKNKEKSVISAILAIPGKIQFKNKPQTFVEIRKVILSPNDI